MGHKTNEARTLTQEDQHGAEPLQRGHDVPKQDDGAQDGEELPGGGDDGAGQRPEAHHRHEDEGLGVGWETDDRHNRESWSG